MISIRRILLVCGISAFCIFSIGMSLRNTTEEETTIRIYVEEPELDSNYCITCEQVIEESEKEITKKKIIEMWNQWYDDQQASLSDPRRERFEELAEYTVAYTEYYTNNQTEHGGILPNDKRMPFLIAAIQIKESAVDPRVVGSRGEVGTMQLHSTALRGYSPEEVRNNPELGIKLGIAWLADQTKHCKKACTIEDMAGPLSVYAGGIKRAKKDGKCLKFSLATNRINIAKYYIKTTGFTLN